MATKLLSIEEIMTGVTTQKLEVDQALKEKQGVMQKQVDAIDRQQADLRQLGADLELLALAEAKKVQQVQTAIGIDEHSNELLNMLSKRKQANQKVFAAAEEVTRKTESTIAKDGFLGWLSNTVTLQESQERLAANVQQANLMSTAIQQTNSDLKATLDGNGERAIANTAQEIAAKARIASVEARLKAEDAVLKGLSYNAQAIEEARNASREKLQLEYAGQGQVLQLRQDQRAARSLSLQEENAARDRELHTLRMDMARFEKEDKERAKGLSQDFADTLNLGYAALGLPTMDRVQVEEVMERFKRGATTDELMKVYSLGKKVRQNEGKQVFGNSPAAAVSLVLDPKLDAQISPAQRKTIEFVQEAKGFALKGQLVNEKNVEEVYRRINDQVKQQVKEQFGTKEGVDGPGYIGRDSVFSVGDVASAESGYLSAPAVKDLPLVTKVLKPAQENKVDLSDPGVTMSLVRAAVKKGEITSTQAAAGLADVYRVANMMNQAQRNFAGYGIELPNGGKQYLVKIGGQKIDLTKPEHIQRILMQTANSSKELQKQEAPLGFLFR